MTRQKRPFLASALLGLALLPLWAQAQNAEAWPSKALRIVVGYPSGSSPDVQARLLAEPLSRAWGSRSSWTTGPAPAAISAQT